MSDFQEGMQVEVEVLVAVAARPPHAVFLRVVDAMLVRELVAAQTQLQGLVVARALLVVQLALSLPANLA